MQGLLFEIGVEDLPALSIDPALSFIKSYVTDGLKELRICYSGVHVFATPRRLVVMIDELSSKQEDIEEEVLGPSVDIAFDAQGVLTKAGLGFINSKGIDESELFRKPHKKTEIIAAVKRVLGKETQEILPDFLADMMRKIPFKKRMRWNDSGESFSRPISWLLCLLDGKHVPITFADITSSDESRGHRFMSPKPFKVTSKEQYTHELLKRFVILCADTREEMFVKSAQEKLKTIGAEFNFDKELMAVVKNLVEYPFVILGSFEEKYLAIPSEILTCEMKVHQKCFAVHDKNNKLLPFFICSAATKPYDEKVFAHGNARVLRARFEDGAFYFSSDKKKTLQEHAAELSKLIFEKTLGSVADKSVRIEKIALQLGEIFGVTEQECALIKKSAPLLKADLTTGVVGEFPELQGIMGRIYAEHDGLEQEVCEAIETHYLPRFSHDQLPPSKIAAILSIADKLDTLVGIIAIGNKPTGNKDPFALRRAAISIVRILVDFGFSIDIEKMIEISLLAFDGRVKNKSDEVVREVKDFMVQRARGLLVEDVSKINKDHAVNFVDSVLLVSSSDLVDVFARVHTLHDVWQKDKDNFDTLVQTFKRASNIVKKATNSQQNMRLDASCEQYLSSLVEKELLKAVLHTKELLKQPCDKKTDFSSRCALYATIFSHVAQIKPKLDAFFEHVMVMVEDDDIRNARLALLSEIKNIADELADFTHI